MTDNKKKIALVLATILLFIALVVLILFVIPKINQLKDLSNQVQSKKSEYLTGKVNVENAISLSSLLDQYKQQAKTLGIALPATSKAEDALVELSAASSNAGVKITSADAWSDNKGNLQIDLSTKGGYENSVSFIEKLKDNLRPVKILNMSMTKVDSDLISDFTLVFPYFTTVSVSSSATSDNSQGTK